MEGTFEKIIIGIFSEYGLAMFVLACLCFILGFREHKWRGREVQLHAEMLLMQRDFEKKYIELLRQNLMTADKVKHALDMLLERVHK